MRAARLWFSRAASVAVVLVIFLAILPGLVDFEDVAMIVSEDIEASEIILIAVLTVASLVASFAALVIALPGLRMSDAAHVNMATTAVSYSVPAGGAFGTAMTAGMLRRLGFTGAEVTRTILTTGVWYVATRLALPVIALALITIDADIPGGLQMAAFAGVVALGAVMVVVSVGLWRGGPEGWTARTVTRLVNGVLRILHRPEIDDIPQRLARFKADTADLIQHRWLALTAAVVGYNVALFAVLAASLNAVGAHDVSLTEAFAVFAVARQVTALPITPGSAGVIELALIGGFGIAGADLVAATAGVLVFRFFTYLLYLPLGVPVWISWRFRHPARRRAPSPRPPRATRPPTLIRHPRDLAAAVLGTAMVLVFIAATRGPIPTFEENLFRLVNRLPDAVLPPLWLVMQFGMVAVVPVAVAIALIVRKPRLAVDLAVAGAGTWLIAKVVKEIAGRPRPGALLSDVILRADAHIAEVGFLGGHAAVAAAIATVATAHARRSLRWMMWAIVAGVGFARIYVGAHLPYDILGGVALGWVIGNVIRLVRGTPPHLPSASTVTATLRGIGLQVSDIEAVEGDLRKAVPFRVTMADGSRVFVKVIGRDQRDADFMVRAWRSLTFRASPSESPFATPERLLEHEALVLMRAQRSDARAPDLITTARIDRATWLMVIEHVDGTPLHRLTRDRIDRDLLERIWHEVGALGAAGIAHGDLRPENLITDDDGTVWIVGFGAAMIDATERAVRRDLAHTLVTTAELAGTERAITASVGALGAPNVRRLAPSVRSQAIPRHRMSLRSRLRLLSDVREAAARQPAGEAAPELPPPPPEPAKGQPLSGKLQVHASDLVRAAAGLSIGLVISLFAARGFILDLEVNVFRLVNELPEGLLVPLEVIMQLGALAAAPALALVAIAAGRRRFGVDLAIAGSAAWMIARVVKMIADRGRPDALLAEIVVRGAPAHGLGFASGHTAVAACLATVAAGHTKRPVRYLCWSLAITVGIARIYVGAHFPLDVVAGAFLGWAVGSTVRFIRGTPAFSPTTAAVMAGLQRLGLPATSVDRLDVHASGSIPCIATLADGSQLMVKAISSHHRDADLLYRLWRFLALGDPEPPLLTPKRQVEHEAFLLLLAQRAGVRVPDVKAVGGIGGGVWLLAEERLTGKSLDRWEGHLSGQVLTEVWAEVAKLHEAGIAHRDLRLSNTFVDDNGEVWLIDLSYGEPTASDHLLLHDRAELLAATACVVGSQAAVEYATTAIGHEALAGVDDLLDPVALSRATRLNARRSPELLPALRTAVQESAGGPRKIASEAHRLEMIRMSGLLAGIGLSYLTIVLLAGAADVFEELGDVGWRWIGVAITAALIAVLARAVGRWGADRRHLHLGTVVRDGLPRVDSLAGTSSSEHPIFAFVVACAIGLALAGLLVENTVLQDLAGEWTAVGAVAITLAASVTFLTWQQLSRGHRPAGMTTVVPEAVTVTLGGYSVALSATVICLLASSTAVGAAVPSGALAVVCLAATTMTAFGPTSGAGIVEPALTVGMIAFGAEPAAAVAAALVFSATWIWLPVAIGAWFRRSTVGPGEPRFGEHAERLVQSGTSSG